MPHLILKVTSVDETFQIINNASTLCRISLTLDPQCKYCTEDFDEFHNFQGYSVPWNASYEIHERDETSARPVPCFQVHFHGRCHVRQNGQEHTHTHSVSQGEVRVP